ncbi:hypothetical protein ABZ863_14435 [Saccharomonospora sp. NPDC046836]|uniref:hypothetical protein n=1 Tax=Saccharomonospora sp. NPDC046836 TaxID=3156921 RepID=UPI003407F9C1
MRTRAVLATVAGALILLLPACSSEAGPTPKAGAPDPGPAALRVKLDALSVDVCFRTPSEIAPPSCQKYVTQLGSVPSTAEKYAGTEHPQLVDAARQLGAAINAYRANGCENAGGNAKCTQTLVDMSTALGEVKTRVASLPAVTGQPG